jgi:hypothetical protein
MPLGAFIADKKLMDCLTNNPVLGHINTFGGPNKMSKLILNPNDSLIPNCSNKGWAESDK